MTVSLCNMMPETVISAYGMDTDACIQSFGKGLINRTWRVQDAGHVYILQQINTGVFPDPFLIADNLELIGTYLDKNHPDYFLPLPLKTIKGRNMVRIGHACKMIAENKYNIVEISYECGFNSLANFNRQFKKLKKISPSDYRRLLNVESELEKAS